MKKLPRMQKIRGKFVEFVAEIKGCHECRKLHFQEYFRVFLRFN